MYDVDPVPPQTPTFPKRMPPLSLAVDVVIPCAGRPLLPRGPLSRNTERRSGTQPFARGARAHDPRPRGRVRRHTRMMYNAFTTPDAAGGGSSWTDVRDLAHTHARQWRAHHRCRRRLRVPASLLSRRELDVSYFATARRSAALLLHLLSFQLPSLTWLETVIAAKDDVTTMYFTAVLYAWCAEHATGEFPHTLHEHVVANVFVDYEYSTELLARVHTALASATNMARWAVPRIQLCPYTTIISLPSKTTVTADSLVPCRACLRGHRAHAGQSVRIQGARYAPGRKDDVHIRTVQRVVLLIGFNVDTLADCPTGNIVGPRRRQ
ncbi:hypothetical protein GGX14DRAFT_625777 [Mycena pura]|uniref:Uncharacterized protein n=1 Tax=Mycena pura TaxID=153505 RepID=A0AAD6VLQ7_9AGAR|nr:hypothetical protein GGX14DRAFT_625777 [Mycena pura]